MDDNMNLNNQNTQDYYNLPTDQTPLLNKFLIIVTMKTSNNLYLTITFEFYFHLPNDTRIYRVTYSEINLSENVQLLNDGINRIPDYLLPHHYNVQSLIQHSIVYQQNRIQQQPFDTSQVYSNNDIYNTALTSVNGNVSYDMQDTRFQNSS
ncbi:unnamed protein product [Rhizophagus irregularis]|nr:unnamed protein product [Rhizophagus irregularis]CAB5356781.1 unnamed protein product [Rhizophagus irregularis]